MQALGVNVGDINKLKEAGFHTVKSVAMATSKVGGEHRNERYALSFQTHTFDAMQKLLAIKGISEAKLEKLKVCFVSLMPVLKLLLMNVSAQDASKKLTVNLSCF